MSGKDIKDLLGKGYHRDRVVEKMDEVQKMKARRVAIEKEMQTLTEELQRVVEADQEEFSKTRGMSGRQSKSSGNNYSAKNPPPAFGVKGLKGPASEKCRVLMSRIAAKEKELKRLEEKTAVKDAAMRNYVRKGPPNNPKRKPKTMAEWKAAQNC